ncbi:MAG: RNA polymerase sigma factor WhiG [Spirochaetes bacterium]|nr:RNA polymerase sigma factor WhiG [Spirochaetota bacterium]
MIDFSKYEKMDENKLWQEYKKKKDEKIREYFVRKYAPLVKYVAGRMAVGMPHNADFEDLVSDGLMGLLDAIEKFEFERGIKFKTYAVTRIRGSIVDGLRERDWIPRSVRQKAKEIESTMVDLEKKFGRPPEEEEIAEAMNISMGEYKKIVREISGASILSLHEIWHIGSDDDEVPMIETIESPESLKPDVIVEKQEIKKIIVEALENLPEKEKGVIVLYYYEGLTLKEIGEVLNVTESRVSQLHAKAIARLRSKLNKLKYVLGK